MKQSITAVIPAKNEEKNIERSIKSVSWCDRILILWMGDDKTGQISRKLGAEVVEMNKSQEDDFIAVQKNVNWAIDNCKTDWILRIDADEEATNDLKKEIQEILATGGTGNSPSLSLRAVSVGAWQSGQKNIDWIASATPRNDTDNVVAFGIPRKQFFFGGFLKGGDWAYDKLVRLFRPKFARYEPLVQVHEQFKVNGNIGYLKNPLLHYSHPDLETAINKFNSYTSVEIEDLKEGYISALLEMIFLPPYIFLRWMIWHHGWRDGLRGLVAGLFRAWYEFILYAKYLERKLYRL